MYANLEQETIERAALCTNKRIGDKYHYSGVERARARRSRPRKNRLGTQIFLSGGPTGPEKNDG